MAENKNGRIFITGDTHGGHDIAKLYDFRIKEKFLNLTKDDVMIVAGDWGVIFAPIPITQEKRLIDWYTNKDYTTVIVLGNHENYDRIFDLPVIEKFGNKVWKVNDSIVILQRGRIYTINGKTIWTMGGGLSIDKKFRRIGISYWSQEIPSKKEMDRGIDELQKVDGKVDYVITHTSPKELIKDMRGLLSIGNKFSKFKDSTTDYLQEIYDNHLKEFKRWYFGHFHIDQNFKEDKLIALYHRVVEI